VEKPLCVDIAGCAEAEALAARAAAAAQERGAPPPLYWVGMEYRYMPTISKLIADADAGVAGEPRMLTLTLTRTLTLTLTRTRTRTLTRRAAPAHDP